MKNAYNAGFPSKCPLKTSKQRFAREDEEWEGPATQPQNETLSHSEVSFYFDKQEAERDVTRHA